MAFESQTTIANRHSFTDTFTNEYDTNQNGLTIITPSSGKRLVVTGVFIGSEGGTAAGNTVSLLFTGNTIFKFHPTTTPISSGSGPILVAGAIDAPLKLTSDLGQGKSYYISVNYREE